MIPTEHFTHVDPTFVEMLMQKRHKGQPLQAPSDSQQTWAVPAMSPGCYGNDGALQAVTFRENLHVPFID